MRGHAGGVSRIDERFRCMGCDARVRLESALDAAALERVAALVRAALADADRRLTRFDPASELCRLNADPRSAVPVSSLVGRLARAAVWAGAASGGLVDATLADEIEAAGYAVSRTGQEPAGLAAALAAAPERRPGRPRSRPGFGLLDALVDGRVVRPPGLRLDSGGLGKGLAADVASELVPVGVRYAISLGGDMAVGGGDWEVAVTGARTGEEVHRLRARGGVATSGIHERVWRREDGTFAHHLLDPSTGEPAWTGLVAVTAVAASALEAEVLAKTALLAGSAGARRTLRRRGGVLQHEDGRVEVIAPAPVVRLPRQVRATAHPAAEAGARRPPRRAQPSAEIAATRRRSPGARASSRISRANEPAAAR